MALDLENIKTEGVVFKKGKDDSIKQKTASNFNPRKKKGEALSGAAKMRATYKTRKKNSGSKKK